MYESYGRGLFGGGMFENLLHDLGRFQNQKRKEEAGVTVEDGFEGVPRLGIPNKFNSIQFGKDDYIYGLVVVGYDRYDPGRTIYHRTVYDKTGKLLFVCDDCKYLEQGMFLVGKKKEVVVVGSKDEKEYGYALYNESEKLTEPIFRPHGMSEKFNSCGFIMVNAFGAWSKEYVLDKTGKIIYTKENSIDSIYIYEAILLTKKGFINLWTGEVICEKDYSGYNSRIDTKDHFFVKVDENCVYQINRKTCQVIIHGERTPAPAPPPPPDPEKVKRDNERKAEEKRKRDLLANAGRNDDCPICFEGGITIKFKKCRKHYVN
jgi:hypothetical protein